MRKYLYFLSYANADRDAYLERFLSDLAVQIRMRTGSPDPDLFFNPETLSSGADWPQDIAEALGTSHVLVPLLSQHYFKSEWCGKQWEVFRQRAMRQEALNPGVRWYTRYIVPVRWTVGLQPPPSVVADLQLDSAEFPREYKREGLRYLMQLRRLEDDYERFLGSFSRQLIDAIESSPFLEDRPPSASFVLNAFANGPRAEIAPKARSGPTSAQFVFLSGERDLEKVQLRAGLVCSREDLHFETLDVDSHLIEHIEVAERANRPVVLVVDQTVVARNQKFSALMKEYAQHSFQNSAVVDFLGDRPIEELEEELQRTLQSLVIRILQDGGPTKRAVKDLPYIGLPTISGPG